MAMRRVLCAAILLLLMAPLLPTFAADEDKEDEKPAAKERLVSLGKLVGHVTTVAGSKDKMTLQVNSDRLQPKRSGRRSYYQVKQGSQKVDLQVAEHVKVRTLNPPTAFDDMGKARRLSPAELRELKGTGNLPGYAADFDSLRNGQLVEVYLARKRRNAAGAANNGQANGEKPIVTMIVILAEKQP